MIQEHKLKELQDDFLRSGGVLLRKGTNKQGEPIVEHKKQGMKWCTRLTFTSEDLRDKNFNFLTRKSKNKFFKAANYE